MSGEFGFQPDALQPDALSGAGLQQAGPSSGPSAHITANIKHRVTLVEMDYVYEGTADSPTGPVVGTLYFTDREYFDDVTNHNYVDVIREAPNFSRALSGEQLGTYISSVSSMELDNADGELDFLLTLACDGSEIRSYMGDITWPVADFIHIFTGIVARVSAPSFDRMSVAIKDTGLLLNKSVGGTTPIGGTGPNADRSRAVNFGYIHNLPLLVEDEPTLHYVHSDDGTGVTVVEVRDKGVSVAYTPNGDGTLDLSATPDGVITADILAEPLGADNVKVSDAMQYFVGTKAGLSAAGYYYGPGMTFQVGDIDDYPLGVSLPESRNIIDLLAAIVESGNCFWAIRRLGEFTFGRLRLNDIASLITAESPSLTEVYIYEDDIDQGSFKLDHSATQYYKYQAYMSRNWLRQTEFATSLSPDDQAVYSRPGLFYIQPDSIGTSYEDAPERYHLTLTVSPQIDTLLSREFDPPVDIDTITQWAAVRRVMFLPWIEVITITVSIDFYELELGDPVRLFLAPRMGIDDAGVLFQVIAITLRMTYAKMDIRLARRTVIQPIPISWTRTDEVIDDSQPPYTLGPIIQPPITDNNGSVVYVPPGSGLGGGGGGFSFGGSSGGMASGRVSVVVREGLLFDTLVIHNPTGEDLLEVGQLIVGGVTAGFGITPPPYEQSYANGAYSGGGGTTNVGAGVIRDSGYYNNYFSDPDPNLTMPYTCWGGPTGAGSDVIFTFNPVSSIEFYMATTGNPFFTTVTLKSGGPSGTTVYTSGSILLWYDIPDYYSTPPWYHFTYP